MKPFVAATSVLTLTAGLAVALPAQAAEKGGPLLISMPRITMELAGKIAHAAVEACRAKGLQVGVAVVDRAGDTQVFLRDTLAPRITQPIAEQKANTALSFNAPTSEMEDRFTKPFSVGKLPGLIFSAGGLPIHAGGLIVGGVGVSGAPSGADDEACAQAGLDAVSFDLESAGP